MYFSGKSPACRIGLHQTSLSQTKDSIISGTKDGYQLHRIEQLYKPPPPPPPPPPSPPDGIFHEIVMEWSVCYLQTKDSIISGTKDGYQLH